jgi:tRNA U34 2-thiouridine synthase MnmA/TrmU
MACNRYSVAPRPIWPELRKLHSGHYARKCWSPGHPSRPRLLRAIDRHKDQTYYLSAISEKSLARTLFPIGDLTKTQVRELAHKYKLPTASRDESMGICFIGEKRKFRDFICAPSYLENYPLGHGLLPP